MQIQRKDGLVHYINLVVVNFQFFVKEKEVRPPRRLI